MAGPFIAYYGDDFTGSTDVMEALSAHGIATVLFTRIPDERERVRFTGYEAVGLAGTSRSQTPEWMDEHLPELFSWLKALDPCYCHYKVCSTFDSSPALGSIGRAMEIGLAVFEQRRTAIVVGAPQLRRYTFFGNLFAGYRDAVYRIDRHPVMRRHPATPMTEADLRLHLAAQTDLPVALGGEAGEDARAWLLDVHDEESQRRAGQALQGMRGTRPFFVVGSSGVEYALLAAQETPRQRPEFPRIEPRQRIAVVSGSCSPTTERQIRTACLNGFCGIPVDYRAIADGTGAEAALEGAFAQASAALEAGMSPILYTALGPPQETDACGGDNDAVGKALGQLLSRLIAAHGLDRVAVAGGDTSSHALTELDIAALTLRYPIMASPGSPVCTAHRSQGAPIDILLKGGQVGSDRYFVALRDGDFEAP